MPQTAERPRTIRIPYGDREGRTPKQKAFHDLVARKGEPGHEIQVTYFCGGIGSGKSFAGAQETMRQAITRPGCVILVAAPTYKMLARATRKAILDICPPEAVANWAESKNELDLVNGSKVWFCSTDSPEYNRGTSVDALWIDEPGLMPKTAYDVLLGRLRGSRGSYKDHLPCWLTGTPKAGTKWLIEEFETGKPDRVKIKVRTIENPNNPAGYVRFLQETYTGPYALQELEAENVKFEGLIWPELADRPPCEKPAASLVRYFAGVDWGYKHPFVIAVIGEDADKRYHLVDGIRQSFLDDDAQVEEAQGFMRKYPITSFWCGPDEPGHIKKWQDAGLPAKAANDDVIPGIQSVASALKTRPDGTPGLTASPAAVAIWTDCQDYQWKPTPDGRPGREEPLKVKDDGADGVRYGLHSEESLGRGQGIHAVVLDWGDDEESGTDAFKELGL
jgi:hypothetical protein